MGDRVKQVFVDRGYRGHGYEGEMNVHVDKQRRGKTANRLWKWMKRRAVVEPGISHLKHGHRMNRNRLKGTQGDQRSPKCSGNELQEVAQASGEYLALHPMDAELGRNPTSHAFQSEHCRSTPFTQLKTTFSVSTI